MTSEINRSTSQTYRMEQTCEASGVSIAGSLSVLVKSRLTLPLLLTDWSMEDRDEVRGFLLAVAVGVPVRLSTVREPVPVGDNRVTEYMEYT